MLTAALVSLSVVFVAELGDKSQLMTMTYAVRHRWWVVLSGVGIASVLVHGLSVAIGHFLGLTRSQRPIAFVAAIAFLLFAVWTWREDGPGDDDQAVKVAEPRHVLLAVGVAIAVLHRRLPEHFLHGLASVLFLPFGLWLLFDGALGLRWVAPGATTAVAVAATSAAAVALFCNRGEHSLAPRAA
jgi:putative Ca2+/H+ antiporter (TMEM165/GDT1 family)